MASEDKKGQKRKHDESDLLELKTAITTIQEREVNLNHAKVTVSERQVELRAAMEAARPILTKTALPQLRKSWNRRRCVLCKKAIVNSWQPTPVCGCEWHEHGFGYTEHEDRRKRREFQWISVVPRTECILCQYSWFVL